MLVVKNPPASAEDAGDVCSVPDPGRSLEEGNGILLQYSCLAIFFFFKSENSKYCKKKNKQNRIWKKVMRLVIGYFLVFS